MSFTIIQQPERLTPTGTEHIFTIDSTLSGETSYKYIVDVWIKPYAGGTTTSNNGRERIARIKSRPNNEGVMIVDLSEILQDAVTSNIRIDYDAPTEAKRMYNVSGSVPSSYVSKPTLLSAFSSANGGNEPGTDIEAGLESQLYFTEYRIMIGEEYINSSGVFIENISQGVNFSEETFEVDQILTGSYSVTYPGIEWLDAFGGNIGTTGVDIKWTDITESANYDAVNSVLTAGTYETPTEPAIGNRLIVKSNYSLFTYVYRWAKNETPGALPDGWIFLETRYDPTRPYWFGNFMPPSIHIWPGVDNKLLNKNYWNNTITNVNPDNKFGHLYDWTKWYMNSDFGNQDGQFLTNGGTPYLADPENQGYLNTYRRRTHYSNQPLMVAFFNSYLHEFINEIRVLTQRFVYKDGYVTYQYDFNVVNNGGGPLTDIQNPYPAIGTSIPEGKRLLHFTRNRLKYIFPQRELDYVEVWTWTTANVLSPSDSSDWSDKEKAASEILRFDMKDESCFSEPVNFVWFNQYGAWDTWTFNARSVKSYDIKRKTYSKTTYKNSSLFSRQSFDPKKVVFNSEVVVGLSAETDYLSQDDARIVEDLLRSNEVYIIENQIEPANYDSDLFNEVPVVTTLIPVDIKTNKVSEYEKVYGKLFQHSIEVEYNSIKKYRTSL